jgi:hypothetical protein
VANQVRVRIAAAAIADAEQVVAQTVQGRAGLSARSLLGIDFFPLVIGIFFARFH